MSHIFTPEEDARALEILESLKTAEEASGILLKQISEGYWAQFEELTELLNQLLQRIERASQPYAQKQSCITLPVACQSAGGSLRAIYGAKASDPEKCKMKLQFELITQLEEAYMRFYYWAYVHSHPEREKQYFERDIFELSSNAYTNAGLETGAFRYEVSFLVLAYNHLDYTKKCVESILRNIPEGLDYELILWDNGSSDGTAQYFESVRPTKLIESRINWAIGSAPIRAVEGRYYFLVCNDVVVLPGAIENMLRCMKSDGRNAFVVPSTPNVSNLQAIPASYQNEEEMEAFAWRNNVSDPFRWEQRVRLCDPISLRDSVKCMSRNGICSEGYLNRNWNMFPDDRMSLLHRRRGNRLVLAKDAYCHHFGSVTLKDEVARQNEQQFYLEGRRGFFEWFGVDPWGPGFCFEPFLFGRFVGDHDGHTEVLGINCGFGGNSLKIKEQIREYCHNEDCTLSNITDDERYLPDLSGVSDRAETVRRIGEFKEFMRDRSFDYIVWDTPFLTQYKFVALLDVCMSHLTERGELLLRRTEQAAKYLEERSRDALALQNGWFVLKGARGDE